MICSAYFTFMIHSNCILGNQPMKKENFAKFLELDLEVFPKVHFLMNKCSSCVIGRWMLIVYCKLCIQCVVTKLWFNLNFLFFFVLFDFNDTIKMFKDDLQHKNVIVKEEDLNYGYSSLQLHFCRLSLENIFILPS